MNIIKHNNKIVTGNGKITVRPKTPVYGYLYNRYAAENVHILAPVGYHVATLNEWADVNDNTTAVGDKSARTAVGDPPVGISTNTHPRWDYHSTKYGTDLYGYCAVPGGVRLNTGVYQEVGAVYYLYIKHTSSSYASIKYDGVRGWTMGGNIAKYGLTVRCVRDTNTGWTAGDVVYDIDGNRYDTVLVHNYIWTVQPLMTKHYRDGTDIPNITDNTAWANDTTGARCAYNNDENYVFL